MSNFQNNFDLDEITKFTMGEEDLPEAPDAWTLEDFQELLLPADEYE